MTILRQLVFQWNGTAMVPTERFTTLAKNQFVEGAFYVLQPHDEVSHRERGFYHASVKAAWDNLDADAVARYPTADDLRKWALIKSGWRVENFTVCGTAKDALKLSAFVKDHLQRQSVVAVSGNVVSTYVARTQKVGNPELGYMTTEEWKQSNQDVLDILSQDIGVTRKVLEKEGRA
jgi:hypothetical protein